MGGSKPLTDAEIVAILCKLPLIRDKCLFTLGTYTGFRISELLSLTIESCTQYKSVKSALTVDRKHMKGKLSGRSVVLHPVAKSLLEDLVNIYAKSGVTQGYLFPISRQWAHSILKSATQSARVDGKVSTHSMRKTFAKRMYEALGHDLVNTQRALGHRNMQSTVSYLNFNQEAIDCAVLGQSPISSTSNKSDTGSNN